MPLTLMPVMAHSHEATGAVAGCNVPKWLRNQTGRCVQTNAFVNAFLLPYSEVRCGITTQVEKS